MATPVHPQIAQPPQYVQAPGQVVQQPQYVQQVQVQQPQYAQQPQVIHYHTQSNYGCCDPTGRTLSMKFRAAHLGLSVTYLVNGVVSMIFGVVGIFTAVSWHYTSSGSSYYYPNTTTWIGADIWAGIFYTLCGIFGVVTQRREGRRQNIHLMNSFFAFSIISFILSLPHVGISIGFIFSYGNYYTIWFNIVSIILALVGLSLSLTFIVFLGKDIYCTKSPSVAGQTAQYQGPNQVVAMQQYPNQPVVMPYQPVQTVYAQAAPTGQPVLAMTQTPIVQPGAPVKSPDNFQ